MKFEEALILMKNGERLFVNNNQWKAAYSGNNVFILIKNGFFYFGLDEDGVIVERPNAIFQQIFTPFILSEQWEIYKPEYIYQHLHVDSDKGPCKLSIGDQVKIHDKSIQFNCDENASYKIVKINLETIVLMTEPNIPYEIGYSFLFEKFGFGKIKSFTIST